jgi:hypothetical protein
MTKTVKKEEFTIGKLFNGKENPKDEKAVSKKKTNEYVTSTEGESRNQGQKKKDLFRQPAFSHSDDIS